MDTAVHYTGDGSPGRISQYWNTERVPEYIETLFESFGVHNRDLGHSVFSESAAERMIGHHFGPREAAAFRSCAVPAMQADYFRYCAVLALGGVYSDADYRCVTSLRPLIERGGGELFCRPETYVLDGHPLQRVLNGFFAFSQPGHPLLRMAVDIATANVEARIAERIWATGENVRESIWITVGPGIFTVMHFLNVLGSFDRLIKVTADTPAEPFMDLYCDVIGDQRRVAEAFEGVRVSPFDSMWSWIAHPEEPLAYKDGDLHWKNVRTRIFR